MTEKPRARWGRFEVLRRVGIGGMGEVFQAFDTGVSPPRPVALKRLHVHLALDKTFARMFETEASVTAELDHPNIVRLHSAERLRDALFMVLEWVDGNDLRRIESAASDAGARPPAEVVVSVGLDVLAALDYAHSRAPTASGAGTVIHRDVSPQNILVARDGIAKMTDFGVAKVRGAAQQTGVGAVKGKFAYMSPEQLLGDTIDHRTDLYSLGLVLFELALGQRAFGDASGLDLVNAVIESRLTPPRSIEPFFPEGMSAFLMRALTRDPGERFQSARAMADAIENAAPSGSGDVTRRRREVAAWVRSVSPKTVSTGAPTENPFEAAVLAGGMAIDGDETAGDATQVFGATEPDSKNGA